MAKNYRELSRVINEALNIGLKAAKTVDDGGSANLDRICICELPRVQEKTLNNAGIDCRKHWKWSGTFVLGASFGQGNKNTIGLEAAINHMKNNGVDCYMHWQVD